ncbi:MAG: hypothetical protein RR123_00410 [Clostridia bacterium]
MQNFIMDTPAFKQLEADKANNTLNHCYMIISNDSIALQQFLDSAVGLIMCKNGYCGKCSDCVKTKAKSHSNVKYIEAEKNNISVEVISNMVENTYISPYEDNYKVYVVPEACKINPIGQNKLLKTLEEPVKNVIILLGVSAENAILDTIKSRSKKINICAFSSDTIKAILQQEGVFDNVDLIANSCFGNITNALNYCQDKTFFEKYLVAQDVLLNMKNSKEVTANLVKVKNDATYISDFLNALELLLNDIIKKSVNCNAQCSNEIQQLSEIYTVNTLVNIEELIIKAKKKLTFNCNLQGVLDALFLGILEVKYKCQ